MGKLLEKRLRVGVVGYAKDGEEGLKICQATQPDIAIIDLQMPKLNGISLMEELVKSLPDIRIIILSGCINPYAVWKVMQYGIHGYILKTENMETMLHGVHAVINNDHFFSSKFLIIKEKLRVDPDAFYKILSPREQEIMCIFFAGLDDEHMGRKLGITAGTVGLHRKNIRKKLQLNNDRELMGYMIKLGLNKFTPDL